MMKKTVFVLSVIILTLSFFGNLYSANANQTYHDTYNATYGTNVGCTFCHTSPPSLNATGTKFKNSGFNYASIAPVPTVTAFTIPATSTSLTITITKFTATDNIPITGYLVNESSTPPTPSTAGWNTTAPKSYTTASTGAKTLYAWVMDAAGVVSSSLSAPTNVTAPPPPDKTKPVVTGFSVTSPSTLLTVTITTFTATDNVGVTGYVVTTSSMAPSAKATTWSATAPATFTFPSTTKSGIKKLYGWAKDASNNVSKSLIAQVTLNLPAPDKTKPVVTGFTVTSPSTSLTVSITTFTATDNVGVTGYMVTASSTAPSAKSTSWSASPPATFTFSSTTKSGIKKLYGWAKDAAGNVSKSLSAQVTLSLAAAAAALQTQNLASPAVTLSGTMSAAATNGTTPAAPQTVIPDTAPDMAIWAGKWFEIQIKNKGFYTGKSGLSSDHQTIPGYLRIGDWDPANKVFQGDLYQYDAQLSQWTSEPLQLNYVSGDVLNFKVWSQVVGDLTYGFTAQIQGTEQNGILVGASFKTLGGYHMQSDTQQGSAGNWAGWLVISGKMIAESEVQVPADSIQH